MVEDSVADSQCGFRAGSWGCVDMVFCVCQLVEKTIEHQSKIFLLFIELHKAYESVHAKTGTVVYICFAETWCT